MVEKTEIDVTIAKLFFAWLELERGQQECAKAKEEASVNKQLADADGSGVHDPQAEGRLLMQEGLLRKRFEKLQGLAAELTPEAERKDLLSDEWWRGVLHGSEAIRPLISCQENCQCAKGDVPEKGDVVFMV